jgi:hypothetical protein
VQPEGKAMTNKIAFGTIAAAVLLAASAQQAAQAQTTRKPVVCNFAWCPILVEVVKSASGAESLNVTFDEVRLAPKYSGATITWKLIGSPDYEFRGDSVMAKGTNAAVAPAQFPVRLISATEYAHDDLNTTTLSYEYEIRVYKKGAPAGSTPLMATGVVVNAS